MLTTLKTVTRFEAELADRRPRQLADGASLRDLIDFDRREVSLRVLYDPELHALELKRIFARAWVVVAHVSELPRPGDFVVRAIGEDRVIVTRTREGEIHILLNVCAHRGAELCARERGNAAVFRCPYHGWVFGGDGALRGAPFQDEMFGDWDKSSLGLVKAKVAVRHGVVFGSFADDPPSLDDWFGDFGWYFDHMYGGTEMEVFNAKGRMRQPANWKAAAEQGIGDAYHTPTVHFSSRELGIVKGDIDDPNTWSLVGNWVTGRPAHGLVCFEFAHAVLKMAPRPEPFPVGWFVAGRLFPGCEVGGSIMRAALPGQSVEAEDFDAQPVIRTATLGSIAPSGPDHFVTWKLYLRDASAPPSVKAKTDAMRPNYLVDADDVVPAQGMTRSARGAVGARQTIKYNATTNGERAARDWPGPGQVSAGFANDDAQWNFWLRWYDMLTDEDAR